jgi:hypothetical protein
MSPPAEKRLRNVKRPVPFNTEKKPEEKAKRGRSRATEEHSDAEEDEDNTSSKTSVSSPKPKERRVSPRLSHEKKAMTN